jgi:hypothetical protein
VQLQRRVVASRVTAGVRRALASPARPLDPLLRDRMEQRFQRDFSRVRVHGDEPAARSAPGLGARAYTVGSQIVLGPGSPAPATTSGQRLFAHELAHVVQQGVTTAAPRSVGPINGPHEDAALRTALGSPVALGTVPAGTIQRSPLSDRVRAAAGPAPTLTSVLAALSGDDVNVNDPDLDKAITQLLGGRAEDIALAQRVRQRALGTTSGWIGPPAKERDSRAKNGPAPPSRIEVRYVPGRTDRRALVIAGVHGSEVQGVEVARQLLKDLTGGPPPEMSAIIVPDLFPDDLWFRDREGPRDQVHPNRNFPASSKSLAESGGKDARGRAIRRENVMLIQLIERFKPERIISIHGTWAPSMAGVFYDTRAPTAAEDARAAA